MGNEYPEGCQRRLNVAVTFLNKRSTRDLFHPSLVAGVDTWAPTPNRCHEPHALRILPCRRAVQDATDVCLGTDHRCFGQLPRSSIGSVDGRVPYLACPHLEQNIASYASRLPQPRHCALSASADPHNEQNRPASVVAPHVRHRTWASCVVS